MYYYGCAAGVADGIICVDNSIRSSEEDVVIFDNNAVSAFIVCFLYAGDVDFIFRNITNCVINIIICA